MTDIVERLRTTSSKGVSVWGDLQMEAADEIERLRLDAARYRWLRERNACLDDVAIFTAVRMKESDGSFSHNQLIALEQMDAEVDAAMKALPLTPEPEQKAA